MNPITISRKIIADQEHLNTLLESNSRFKRIYDEYIHITEDLWILESNAGNQVTDEYLNYLKIQSIYLEKEIENYLCTSDDHSSHQF